MQKLNGFLLLSFAALFLNGCLSASHEELLNDTWTAKGVTLSLDGEVYEVTTPLGPDKGRYEFDTSVQPHRMKIVGEEGPNKGRTIFAIYELAEDKLKVCYNMIGSTYPESFDNGDSPSSYVINYTRKKK